MVDSAPGLEGDTAFLGDSETTAAANSVDETGAYGDGLGKVLAERRSAIEAQLVSIEDEARTVSGGIGFGKRIGEGTNIAVERLVEVAMHDRLTAELETVRRAEERLATDAAGHCEDCGVKIPDERLEALPWAIKCVDCAAG